MKTLIVGKFKIKAFVAAVVILLLVSGISGKAAHLPDLPALARLGLDTLSFFSLILLAILALWGIWGLVVKMGLLSLFDTEQVNAVEEFEEAQPIKRNLDNLATTLADLERDAGNASLLLLDARQYASTLVRLIKGIAMKAEAMREEIEQLITATEAISSQEPLKVAQAAGQIKDDQIRELLLCDLPLTSDYWTGAARLIATQLGTLRQWAEGYDRFTSNLLVEVSNQKAQLSAMTAALELTGTARPLMQISANLDEARMHLQPQHKPELMPAFRELPALNVGLME